MRVSRCPPCSRASFFFLRQGPRGLCGTAGASENVVLQPRGWRRTDPPHRQLRPGMRRTQGSSARRSTEPPAPAPHRLEFLIPFLHSRGFWKSPKGRNSSGCRWREVDAPDSNINFHWTQLSTRMTGKEEGLGPRYVRGLGR